MKLPASVLLLLVNLLAINLPAATASAGPLTGRVVDPDGRAVAGAQVLLLGGGATVRTTVTDPRGAFTIEAPDAGRFEVRVAADGFRADALTIDASTTPRDVGELRLQISAISESIVVSAAQVEIPLTQASSSVTVISGAELQKRQVHTVADALRAVPGMTVVRYGGLGALTNVFPRGGESDYSLVVVDGIQANVFGGGFDFGHLSTENVDRIEVIRGPQSALFGSNAIGSVVRVVTRRGGPPTGAATIEGGSFGTWRSSVSTSGNAGRFEWGGAADRLDSDGFNGQSTAAGAEISNDDYTRSGGSLNLGWRAANGSLLRGDLRYGRDQRGFPGPFGSNPIGAYFDVDTTSRGTNERWLGSLSGLTHLSSRVRVQGQLSHGRLDSDFASPFGASELLSRRTAVRGQADVTVRETFDVSAGIDYQRERAGSTFITGASGEIPITRYVAGYFAEGRWRSARRLFVNAGIRVERIHRDALEGNPVGFSTRPAFATDSIVSVNPRISAAWFVTTDPGTFTKLRASAGTGIRPPDGFEIAFTDNPSLKPERNRSFDIGVDQAFAAGRGLVEATAFFNTYDDLIVAVGSFLESSRYTTDNISNARARGIELAGTARGRTAGIDLQVRLGYTFLDTEILAVDRSGDAPPPFRVGDPLLRRPRHQFSTDFVATANRVSAYLHGGGRGVATDVEPSLGTFHPEFFDARGYTVWNAGASFRIHRSLELFGRIENLFDRDYEEAFGFPALGRGAFAGIRLAFHASRPERASVRSASESKGAAGR